MTRPSFSSLSDVTARLRQLLAASPADETELLWLESRRGRFDPHGDPTFILERPRISVLIRVAEGQRLGWYRTDGGSVNELEHGIRAALAVAKAQSRLKHRSLFPTEREAAVPSLHLFDRQISDLDAKAAAMSVQEACKDGEIATLCWGETRVAIFNSHGLERTAGATETTFRICTGNGPGSGHAAASARSLEALDPAAISARARGLAAPGGIAPLPPDPCPVMLAPEAAIELIGVLNTHAFSAHAYLDGTSFLSQHRNVQVFHRDFTLWDDGVAENGLPFPFDLEGSLKRRLDLIVQGTPTTPALSHSQGLQANLEPTAHAVGGQDAFFSHLFLQPGLRSDEELLAAMGEGFFIGWLEPLECFEPQQLHFRTIARGMRRVENGTLGAALPDCIWEDSLLRALARLQGVGTRPVVRSTPSTPLGGISAPALVLAEVEFLRPLTPDR